MNGGHVTRAAVAAGLLATLALPWVHDEADRSAGFRAVAPAAGGSTPTAWWRAAAAAVVVVAVMTLARDRVRHLVARRPPRSGGSWSTVVSPDGARRAPPTRTARHATAMGIAFAALATVAGQALRDLGGRAEAGPVVVAAAGAVSAAVWARRAWRSRPESGTTLRGSAVAAVLAAAVVFAASAGIDWREGRPAGSLHLERERPAAAAAPGPDAVEGAGWSAEADRVLAAGADLVLVRYEGEAAPSGRTEVSVVDATGGEERWRLRRDGWIEVSVDVAGEPAVGTLVTLAPVDGDLREVVARDLAGGQVRWHRRVGGRPGSVDVVGGQVLVSGSTEVVALDGATGRPRWRRDLGELSCELGVASGVLVSLLGCGETVVGVDAVTGADRWLRDLGDTGAVGDPVGLVPVEGGFVVAGGVGGGGRLGGYAVVGVDAATGRVRWRRAGAGTIGAPAVVGDHVVAVLDTSELLGMVAEIDRAEAAALGLPVDGPPVRAVALQAFDVATGEPAWSLDLADLTPPDAVVSVGGDGDRAYVVADDGSVTVVGAGGEALDRLEVPVCDRPCDEGLLLDDSGRVVVSASGGVLAVQTGRDTLGPKQVTVVG